MFPFKFEAVTINHNTSEYTELLIRSLFARHDSALNLSLTVYDNESSDSGIENLKAYLKKLNTPLIQSGFGTELNYAPESERFQNSHGEILNRFVLSHPNCDYYLFMDSDICFFEDNTIDKLISGLLEEPNELFGVTAEQSWDGINAIPHSEKAKFSDRIHPCCTIIKNTPLFQSIVKNVGLSGSVFFLGDRTEFIDTFGMMTRVMKTHSMNFKVLNCRVIHFNNVSYNLDGITTKNRLRDTLLNKYRQQDTSLRQFRPIAETSVPFKSKNT